jgi:hypothetical protein
MSESGLELNEPDLECLNWVWNWIRVELKAGRVEPEHEAGGTEPNGLG